MKPYYKLVIGSAPPKKRTVSDLRFGCGRLRIEVSSDYPDAPQVMRSMFDLRWDRVVVKMAGWMDAHPHAWVLTESAGGDFEAEIARIRGAA